jgi:hypothetical protein
MYDYCVQYTYAESKLIFSTINKERKTHANHARPVVGRLYLKHENKDKYSFSINSGIFL